MTTTHAASIRHKSRSRSKKSNTKIYLVLTILVLTFLVVIVPFVVLYLTPIPFINTKYYLCIHRDTSLLNACVDYHQTIHQVEQNSCLRNNHSCRRCLTSPVGLLSFQDFNKFNMSKQELCVWDRTEHRCTLTNIRQNSNYSSFIIPNNENPSRPHHHHGDYLNTSRIFEYYADDCLDEDWRLIDAENQAQFISFCTLTGIFSLLVFTFGSCLFYDGLYYCCCLNCADMEDDNDDDELHLSKRRKRKKHSWRRRLSYTYHQRHQTVLNGEHSHLLGHRRSIGKNCGPCANCGHPAHHNSSDSMCKHRTQNTHDQCTTCGHIHHGTICEHADVEVYFESVLRKNVPKTVQVATMVPQEISKSTVNEQGVVEYFTEWENRRQSIDTVQFVEEWVQEPRQRRIPCHCTQCSGCRLCQPNFTCSCDHCACSYCQTFDQNKTLQINRIIHDSRKRKHMYIRRKSLIHLYLLLLSIFLWILAMGLWTQFFGYEWVFIRVLFRKFSYLIYYYLGLSLSLASLLSISFASIIAIYCW